MEPTSGKGADPDQGRTESLSAAISPLPEAPAEELPGRLVPLDRTLPAAYQDSKSVPKVSFVRCPYCTARIPEYLESCPACGADLLSGHQQQRGLRALFHLSGDLTFTPKMVVFLFVATLAAFLTFTWLLSGRRPEDDRVARLDLMAGSGEFENQSRGVEFSRLKKEFLDPASTGFRKDAVRQEFLGKRVIWTGLVKEIRSAEGQTRVDLVMEQPESRSFVTMLALPIEKNRRLITELGRGQRVLFSGKIQDFDTGGSTEAFDYFRVVLNDGIILQ